MVAFHPVSSLNNHLCISHCRLVGCIPYPLSSFDNYISSFPCACRLFGFNAGKLRMDERIDLSMSDPDLVPLLIQVLALLLGLKLLNCIYCMVINWSVKNLSTVKPTKSYSLFAL